MPSLFYKHPAARKTRYHLHIEYCPGHLSHWKPHLTARNSRTPTYHLLDHPQPVSRKKYATRTTASFSTTVSFATNRLGRRSKVLHSPRGTASLGWERLAPATRRTQHHRGDPLRTTATGQYKVLCLLCTTASVGVKYCTHWPRGTASDPPAKHIAPATRRTQHQRRDPPPPVGIKYCA